MAFRVVAKGRPIRRGPWLEGVLFGVKPNGLYGSRIRLTLGFVALRRAGFAIGDKVRILLGTGPHEGHVRVQRAKGHATRAIRPLHGNRRTSPVLEFPVSKTIPRQAGHPCAYTAAPGTLDIALPFPVEHACVLAGGWHPVKPKQSEK